MAKMASLHADQTTIPSDYLASFVIHAGNNLDVLPTLPDNSVDSIVTDPPYELGFMGKKWDNSGIAYSVELWTECLRVLKPGGHLLSFGGTRTWHRVAVAIEDAGFDVRDSIAWMYGSGFPKSLDVSKAIDKGTGQNPQRQLTFTAWMRSTGITASKVDEITGTKMGSHYTTHPTQPAIATADLFDALRPYLPEVPEEIERLVAERTGIEWKAYKNREVIGSKPSSLGGTVAAGERNQEIINYHKTKIVDITAPSTPEAEQWQGWGTALKPAFEPIVVARKPLAGKTVAANVLEHGTGALNIDGSRIGTEPITINTFDTGAKPFGGAVGEPFTSRQSQGRWPANVILDEYSAGELDEQSGTLTSGNIKPYIQKPSSEFSTNHSTQTTNTFLGNTGGASRFFYCAKASKRDRNEGLEESNFHPTVKPTNLMRYLVKLVTPPGGTVLDPFTGSGSTGKAAILEGFDFIGIELTEEYLPIIDARLKHAEQVRDQQEQAKDEGLF
jgi:DNA modification methylase